MPPKTTTPHLTATKPDTTEADLRRILGPRCFEKAELATQGLDYGSEEYWEALEPVAAAWVADHLPSDCIKFTYEFRQWIRYIRSQRGPGAVLVDAVQVNLNKGKVIPQESGGRFPYGYLPLNLDEGAFSDRSLGIAADYFDATLDMVLNASEDEIVVSVILELPNGYLAVNNELIMLAK